RRGRCCRLPPGSARAGRARSSPRARSVPVSAHPTPRASRRARFRCGAPRQASARSSPTAAPSATSLLLPLDLPARALPIGRAQLPLIDFAGILARQGVAELDPLRHLIAGEVAAQEALDLFGGEHRALFDLDMSAQGFAVFLVGNAEDGAVAHAWHRHQHALDLGGIDVDAARDHHVAGAVAQEEIAVRVEVADVAERDESLALDLAPL